MRRRHYLFCIVSLLALLSLSCHRPPPEPETACPGTCPRLGAVAKPDQAAKAAAENDPAEIRKLLRYVPDQAKAVVVVPRGGMSLVREFFASNKPMKEELAGFLRQRIGVDLTEVQAAVAYGMTLSPEPVAALLLLLPDTASAAARGGDGALRSGAIVRVMDGLYASAMAGVLVIGSADGVKHALAFANQKQSAGVKTAGGPVTKEATAQKATQPTAKKDTGLKDKDAPAGGAAQKDKGAHAKAKGAQQPAGSQPVAAAPGPSLKPLVEDHLKAASLLIALDAAGAGHPALGFAASVHGAERIALSLAKNQQIRLSVQGPKERLETGKKLLASYAEQALARLDTAKKEAVLGGKLLEGSGAIISFHQLRALWEEAEPKVVGNALESSFKLPFADSHSTLAVVGIMSAIAIPTFIKYIRRSKGSEVNAAMSQIRMGFEQHYLVSANTKTYRFPKSTPWTPHKACCEYPGKQCPGGDKGFDHPSWKALNFKKTKAHRYQYRLRLKGRGKKAELLIEAQGDLDCDGTFSRFTQHVTRSDKEGLAFGAIQKVNELE